MKGINKKLALIFILSAAVPIFFQILFRNQSVKDNLILYMVFWVLINYLFFGTIADMLKNYYIIFTLKGIKINAVPYAINIFLYALFIVFSNGYFVQQLYIPDNVSLNSLVSVEVALIILFGFLINLYLGAFPQAQEKENSLVYTISSKNSFRNGKDRYGTVVGSFEEGIVLGTLIVFFNDITNVYTNKKKDSVVIKAKGAVKNFLISVGTQRSKDKLISIIDDAVAENKLDNKKVNIAFDVKS
ncbi:putative membrane protein [Peptoniphilus sp. ING2-D1G]|nr:putative membrane protein [Peptoniphilus sp. ING2-D1G]